MRTIGSGAWPDELRFDPRAPLLAAADEALAYFARRDLLCEKVPPVSRLWHLPGAERILRHQQNDGSWRYPGKSAPYNDFALLETFRQLGILVEMYGMSHREPAVQGAAGFMFSRQTGAGDIRGILGNQYMPYYHGAILEVLIKAGYMDNPRVKMGLEWLLSMRQEDGGWIIPVQALPASRKTESLWHSEPVPPDRALPFSHLATGMALRALTAHRRFRHRHETLAAARLLKQRFLKADRYHDRRAAVYWTRFQFPYWWTDLLSGLDIMVRTGIDRTDADVQRALGWFISNQENDGLWPTGYTKGRRAQANRAWVGLAICRVLRRLL